MVSSNRKSILFLPRWYPNKADIQLGTFIRQQALLLKDDFDIHVIYVQADSSQHEEFTFVENSADGIHEIIVYFKQGNGVLGKLINAKRYKKAQQLAFEKIKPSVSLCHVHVPYRPAFLALELKKNKNIPFVITEHWSGHLNGEYMTKNFADKKLFKRVLSKSSGITCVSNLLAQKFRENTGFSARVIPNYITHATSTDRSRTVPTNRIEILTVSDLNDATKNISGLLHAFEIALKSNANLHLTLVGGGPDEEKIRHLVQKLHLQDHLTFKGRLAHDQVLEEMNHCDFYVCNSNVETFGMTVAEALRCGKPVISTRCGGPEEFLHEGNSILIDNDSVGAGRDLSLPDAILKMATGFKKYDAQKLAAEIETQFGADAVRKMWVDFYTDALEHG